MLGEMYIKAISAELQKSLDNPSTSEQTGYRTGLAKAMEIIQAIDKREVDSFMEDLLNGTLPDGLEEL